MLISSQRHTAADLKLWAEYEETDLIHGQRPAMIGKVERSIAEIKSFAAAGPCYAGVSWGKDSVVLASLVAKSGAMIPLVWVRPGIATNPDCPAVRDTFVESHVVDYRECSVDAGVWNSEAVSNADAFAAAREAAGTSRYLSGLRADESGTRKMSLRRLGLSTDNVCRPLGWWTSADVFGYLATNALPVHSVYAMLGAGRWSRDELRVDSIGGDHGGSFGRREHEREYYGDVLNRLAAEL